MKFKSLKNFGVIVFESDQDFDPKTGYVCYDDLRLLKIVFHQYKSDKCLDKTNIQGDYSVIGSEFINFTSTVITCRLIKKARGTGILDEMSYVDLMEDLSSARHLTDASNGSKTSNKYQVHILKTVFDELGALGLSIPIPQSKTKKHGHPRKHPIDEKSKRPRGHPRNNP